MVSILACSVGSEQVILPNWWMFLFKILVKIWEAEDATLAQRKCCWGFPQSLSCSYDNKWHLFVKQAFSMKSVPKGLWTASRMSRYLLYIYMWIVEFNICHAFCFRKWLYSIYWCSDSNLQAPNSTYSLRSLRNRQRHGVFFGDEVAEDAGHPTHALHLPGQRCQLPGNHRYGGIF